MNRDRLTVNILWLFFTTNVAGFLLYYGFPATGPVYARRRPSLKFRGFQAELLMFARRHETRYLRTPTRHR